METKLERWETAWILYASEMAAAAHHGQVRTGLREPYILHPLRVGAMAVAAGLPVDAVIAGVLHDVLEDCDGRWRAMLEKQWPRSMPLIVALSKWWDTTASPETVEVNKAVYYRKILNLEHAPELKLIDRTDNLRDSTRVYLANAPGSSKRKWVRRYLAKTEAEMPQLVARITNPYVRDSYHDALAALQSVVAQDVVVLSQT